MKATIALEAGLKVDSKGALLSDFSQLTAAPTRCSLNGLLSHESALLPICE